MEHFLHKESTRISQFMWYLIISRSIRKKLSKIYSQKKYQFIIEPSDWAKFEKNNYYVALSMLFVYEEEIQMIKIKQVSIFTVNFHKKFHKVKTNLFTLLMNSDEIFQRKILPHRWDIN